MVDATGTTNYSYDAVDRLTSVTFSGSRTVSYTYSNAGPRATTTYPGGSNQVTYGYDAANNLTSVTDWNSKQKTYAYNNAGAPECGYLTERHRRRRHLQLRQRRAPDERQLGEGR